MTTKGGRSPSLAPIHRAVPRMLEATSVGQSPSPVPPCQLPARSPACCAHAGWDLCSAWGCLGVGGGEAGGGKGLLCTGPPGRAGTRSLSSRKDGVTEAFLGDSQKIFGMDSGKISWGKRVSEKDVSALIWIINGNVTSKSNEV